MSPGTLEGQLAVRLGPDGATLRSSPPLQTSRFFAGRESEEVLALLPQLYAVCGRAHVAAAAAAMPVCFV